MANSQGQNCQRGVVFLCFLIMLAFLIIVIIKLIKKLIDPQQGEAYQEGKEEARKKGEDSTLNFDDIAKKTPVVAEDDPLPIKLTKKVEEFQFSYFPLLVLFPLNLVTGTAYAFLLVDFFFLLIPLVLFNVMKLHHGLTENKCVRVALQNLWLVLVWFMFVNLWGATPLLQPYIVVAG